MVEANDLKEQENMKQEEQLSETIYTNLKLLAHESKELKKEYAHLLKTGKKIKKIIKAKEKRNNSEINERSTLNANLAKTSVNSIKKDAKKFNKEDAEESKLSKEEATILQDMLKELHETFQHGETILKTDKELYNLLQETYKKDLEDYQLETEDMNRL